MDLLKEFLIIIGVVVIASCIFGYIYYVLLKKQRDEELDKKRREFLEGRIKNPHPYDSIDFKPIEPGRKNDRSS